ncbi:MAG TPA: hypothetical protein VIG66_00530 [Noviherbaspirillum sp.]
MKTKSPLDSCRCTECAAILNPQADLCPDCGYPQLPARADIPAVFSDLDAVRSARRESRVLQLGGLCILGVGAVAVAADSRFAAAVTFATGGSIYLAGLLGAWWNRRQ